MNASDSFCSKWSPRLLSILRIVVGLLFMEHGCQKLLGFPPSAEPSAPPALLSLMGVGALLELFGGLFVALGLFTRPVAFILSGEMAVAYLMFHAQHGFWPIVNKGELAAIYCFVFFYLWAAGAGPWSLDSLLRRGDEKKKESAGGAP